VIAPETATSYMATSEMISSSNEPQDDDDDDNTGISNNGGGNNDDTVEVWDCDVAIYMPEIHPGILEKQPDKVSVDPDTRQATFSDLVLSEPGRYFLEFECVSSTTGKEYKYVGRPIDVFPQNYTLPQANVEKLVTLRYDVDYATVAEDKELFFAGMMYNKLFPISANYRSLLANWEVTEGSVLCSFTVGGETEMIVDDTINAIYGQVTEDDLQFDGNDIPATDDVKVDYKPYYGHGVEEADTGLHAGIIAAIVIACLLAVVIIIIIVVVLVKKSANKKEGKMSGSETGSSGSSSAGSAKALVKSELNAQYDVISAPPTRDLYPAAANKSSAVSSRTSTPLSISTAAYGNTKPMSPTDFDFEVASNVSLNRPNGPMLTTNLRRDSLHIPVDCKMPGAE